MLYYYRWQNCFYVFKMKSSSTKIVIHASLCEGPIFYIIVESVYLLLSILEANTCVNCVHWFLHVYLLHLLYWFMLTTIHEIYMLQVESNRWNLNLPLCCFNAFTLNLLLYELTLMQDLLMLVLKVLFMKSLCYMIQLFNHCLYHCFESLHSSHMLTIVLIKIMIACHLRNYICYRLPTRGRVGTKLGDADTSPTYL